MIKYPGLRRIKRKLYFICPVCEMGWGINLKGCPKSVSRASASFQSLMEKVIGGVNYLEAFIYLDDITIFGRILEKLEQRLLFFFN